MDKSLLGKCGFYCGVCPTYIRGSCAGCVDEHAEGDCFTRDCVLEKGLEACPLCAGFPCATIIEGERCTVLDKDWLRWKASEKQMKFHTASAAELPTIEKLYKNTVAQMLCDALEIWDEVYPCCALPEDISTGRLFVLSVGERPIAAFALSREHGGSDAVKWAKPAAHAVYIDRFCVDPEYRGAGTGSTMLKKACALAASVGAEYLRLFVVDSNSPAIAFYIKNGFVPVEGEYTEEIEPGLTLRQLGFEKKVS